MVASRLWSRCECVALGLQSLCSAGCFVLAVAFARWPLCDAGWWPLCGCGHRNPKAATTQGDHHPNATVTKWQPSQSDRAISDHNHKDTTATKRPQSQRYDSHNHKACILEGPNLVNREGAQSIVATTDVQGLHKGTWKCQEGYFFQTHSSFERVFSVTKFSRLWSDRRIGV